MLSVYVDFKCPASYLAVEPVLEMQRRTGVEITWHPFIFTERDMPDGSESDTVALSHQQARLMSLRRTYIMYAALRGLDLKFPKTLGSTDLALGALLAIDGDKLPFIKRAFEAYWANHADLDDETIVKGLLEKCGAADEMAESITWRQALRGAQAFAESQGIVGTPAMIIDGQCFIGREHLPWVEEIIAKS